MAGGWASALGAAILNANQGHSERVQRAFENKRQLGADSRAEQELVDQRKLNALHASILNDQNNELEKGHTEGDINRMLALLGPTTAMDTPDFVAKNQAVGTPLPQIPGGGMGVRKAQLQQVEGGPAGIGAPVKPVDSIDTIAGNLGVTPHTGVVLSPEMQAAAKDRERKTALDDLQTNAMREAYGGGGDAGGGFDIDPNTHVPADTPKNRRLGSLLGPNDPIVKIYGPAGNSPQNVYDRALATESAKTMVPPAAVSRVTGEMDAMTRNLGLAQQELEKMYPGIGEVIDPATGKVKDDGRGSYNTPFDLAKAKANRTLYNFSYTPYNKAIQSASLGNVQGWAALIPNRMNPAIVAKAQEHQSAYGNETPLATYTRNKDLMDMITANRQQLVGASAPVDKRTGGPVTNTFTPSGVNTPAPAAAPQQAAPQQSTSGAQLKPGDTIAFADIVSRTRGSNVNPNTLAAQLMKEGVRVTK